jgi:hypothetical protein
LPDRIPAEVDERPDGTDSGEKSNAVQRSLSASLEELGAFGGSLEDHPAFRRIVRHARRTFNAYTCMLSVIEEDQQ